MDTDENDLIPPSSSLPITNYLWSSPVGAVPHPWPESGHPNLYLPVGDSRPLVPWIQPFHETEPNRLSSTVS